MIKQNKKNLSFNVNELNSSKSKYFISNKNISLEVNKNPVYKNNKVLFESSTVTTRSSLPLVKQWTNGVYNYNLNFTKNLPLADNVVHKLIKNFFAARPVVTKGKKTRLVIRRLFRMTLNSILVSKPEIKHFSDKISLTVFLYNKKKTSLLRKLNPSVEILNYPLNNTSSEKIWDTKQTNIKKSRGSLFTNSKNKKSYLKAGKKILYKRRNLKRFFYAKQKWNLINQRLWLSRRHLLGLRLKKRSFFKSNLQLIHNKITLSKKLYIKNNKTRLLNKLSLNKKFVFKSRSKLITAKQINNYKHLLTLWNYMLNTLNKKNVYKRISLIKKIRKIKLNLYSLIIYMSKKGYKVNEISNNINQKLNRYVSILNYVYKKYLIRKDIAFKKLILKRIINKLNRSRYTNNTNKTNKLYKKRLNRKSTFKMNLSSVSLKSAKVLSKQYIKRNTITKPVNSVKSISYKNQFNNLNKISSVYTTKNLSYLSKRLKINLVNFINIPFTNKNEVNKPITSKKLLVRKGSFNKVKFIKTVNKSIKITNNFYNTKLYKNQILSLNSINNKLINIYVRGRKLTKFEKQYAKNLVYKARKHNITKVINRLYLYKTKNMNYFFDYFKKLIVNNRLGYKRLYKVELVRKPKHIKQNLKSSKNYPRHKNNNINLNYSTNINKFKRVLVKSYKIVDKSLINENNKITFKRLKINNKNIIILNKIKKIDRFLNKYFKHYEYTHNKNLAYINELKNLYKFKYLKDILVEQITYLNYIKMLSFNNSLYKSWMLTPLKNLISKLYNKQVIFNFVNLKYLYLSSDLLTQAIVLKLRNIRKNRLHGVLKRVLNLVLVSKLNLHTQNTFNPTYKYLQKHYNKYKYINNIIFKPSKDYSLNKTFNNNVRNLNLSVSHPNNNSNKNKVFSSIKWLNQVQSNTLNLIKYKSLFGLKLEASGRLTKRSTASRAVFKFKFKGNLRNDYIMTRDINPRIKGLNLISNIQYTKINSYNRNGSFGIKTWINNN